MANNNLDQIQKMLTALLQGSGNIHWVAGYAYGRTSNGDPFIVLYPAGDHLKFQVCRVYPHDFGKLPDAIIDAMPEEVPEQPGDKEKARKHHNYHECPLMRVVTYDGKETQMGPEKRFSDVLFVVPDRRSQEPAPTHRQAPASPPADDGNPFGDVPAFRGPEEALSWAMQQRVFLDEAACKMAYDELKARLRPQTAVEMFDAWVGHVKHMRAQGQARTAKTAQGNGRQRQPA